MKRNMVQVDAVMVLILILLIVQIWLFSATLDSYLAGHRTVAFPAAVASLLLFAACGSLLGFLKRGADRQD